MRYPIATAARSIAASILYLTLLAGVAMLIPACHPGTPAKYSSWRVYGGSTDNIH